MKHIIALPFLLSPSIYADETVTMSNGMICFRNEATQQIHSCGPALYQPAGFVDVNTGKYYPPVRREFAIDPETSLPIYLPPDVNE